jgi:hypothetical protein
VLNQARDNGAGVWSTACARTPAQSATGLLCHPSPPLNYTFAPDSHLFKQFTPDFSRPRASGEGADPIRGVYQTEPSDQSESSFDWHIDE